MLLSVKYEGTRSSPPSPVVKTGVFPLPLHRSGGILCTYAMRRFSYLVSFMFPFFYRKASRVLCLSEACTSSSEQLQKQVIAPTVHILVEDAHIFCRGSWLSSSVLLTRKLNLINENYSPINNPLA